VKAFTFVQPRNLAETLDAISKPGSVMKAGGTDLLDRMKERIDEPDRVVWLAGAAPDLKDVAGEMTTDFLVLHALTTLAELAASADVKKACPALAEAAALAASPQIRALATLGGNLFQHTRCGYYRHRSFPCFKRGDDHCPVLADGAVQDTAAIFGNDACASAHPSSLAPVLCAVDARPFTTKRTQRVVLGGGGLENEIWRFFQKPTRGVAPDLQLPDGAPLLGVLIPRRAGRRAAYEEVRQKAAFDWALVSCCVRLDMDGEKVRNPGVWLGSVAPTPWHAEAAEKALAGKTLDDETIAAAADAAVAGATPLPGNAYKVDLVKVVVRRALERLRSAK
jgi:xanthine dehydrogenase YagS FAD-binding subunit